MSLTAMRTILIVFLFLSLAVLANLKDKVLNLSIVELERIHSEIFVEDLALQIVYRVSNSLNEHIHGEINDVFSQDFKFSFESAQRKF